MPRDMARVSGHRRTIRLVLLSMCLLTDHVMAQSVSIREWLVPWPDTAPSDPVVDARGRVWFIGTDYVANFSRDSEEFNRYDLRKGTVPGGLLAAPDRKLWFTSRKRRHLGSLDPSTGRVATIDMPDRKAREPRSMIFDPLGDIWFTEEDGGFVGRLRAGTEDIELVRLEGRNVRPLGLAAGPDGAVWVAATGRNEIYRIDAVTLTPTVFEIPDEDARPRRVGITSDGRIWYTDFDRGRLGRLTPDNGEFLEWPMPGGGDSAPFALAVDRDDRLWIVETGRTPNRLVGFDTATGVFLTETNIPSGADSVEQLHYYEPAGEVWFSTATNYLGRAVIH